MIPLTDEYAAAVRLGVISEERAQYEMRRWKVRGIEHDDELQQEAFMAGFLWAFFKHGWPMKDSDMSSAEIAWDEWCEHIAKIENA